MLELSAREDRMTSRTTYLARLIGLYCILIALALSIRGQATVQTVTAMLHDPSMLLLLGVIALAAGLAMILAHNVWSGGALPVAVTVVGWLSAIKGLLFLVLPAGKEAGLFLDALRYQQLFYLYMGVDLLIGIWFTYRGFAPQART
jgi:hypothetical protein